MRENAGFSILALKRFNAVICAPTAGVNLALYGVVQYGLHMVPVGPPTQWVPAAAALDANRGNISEAMSGTINVARDMY